MYFFADHTKKKIVILLGHPDTSQTLSGEFALLYESSAKKAGHDVQRFNLGEMNFDPILHKGYKVIQKLESDVIKLQEAIKWADHFVVIYPNWWCTMPALLKGLFDRMWMPGFCFHMKKDAHGKQKLGWQKLMKGKTARVIVLSGTHPFFIRILFGDYTNEIARGILGFAGFKTRITKFGPSEHAPEWKLNEWRRRVIRLAQMGE